MIDKDNYVIESVVNSSGNLTIKQNNINNINNNTDNNKITSCKLVINFG